MIKICITGPESSGKTTLSQTLVRELGATLVPEYARQYLEEHGPEYSQSDLLLIAKGQLQAESQAIGDLVICDTGLETIQIWSDWKYGDCDPWIKEKVQESDYTFYLLCKPDVTWEADPLRENRFDREAIFKAYEKLLTASGSPVFIIEGIGQRRVEMTLAAINQVIKKTATKRSF